MAEGADLVHDQLPVEAGQDLILIAGLCQLVLAVVLDLVPVTGRCQLAVVVQDLIRIAGQCQQGDAELEYLQPVLGVDVGVAQATGNQIVQVINEQRF
jgi:hypothetical protein